MVRILLYRDDLNQLWCRTPLNMVGRGSTDDIEDGEGTIEMQSAFGIAMPCTKVWCKAQYLGETVDTVHVLFLSADLWMPRSEVNLHGRVREDEKALWISVKNQRMQGDLKEHMDFIIRSNGINSKRADRVLKKWTQSCMWEFGKAGLRHGWVPIHAKEIAL